MSQFIFLVAKCSFPSAIVLAVLLHLVEIAKWISAANRLSHALEKSRTPSPPSTLAILLATLLISPERFRSDMADGEAVGEAKRLIELRQRLPIVVWRALAIGLCGFLCMILLMILAALIHGGEE